MGLGLRIPQILGVLAVGMWSFVAPAFGQDSGAIGGFTLGFVFDGRSSSLRPLVGIPGAAVLGADLDTGVPLRHAYLSPRQNYAACRPSRHYLLEVPGYRVNRLGPFWTVAPYRVPAQFVGHQD